MALTPIDIQQKTFGTALRGYDLDEVDDFLDEVVTTFRDYDSQLAEASHRIAALEAEVAEKGDVEGSIARVFLAAQRSADTILAEAQTESERILEEARLDAERVVAEAESRATTLSATRSAEADRVQGEIDALRASLSELRSSVRAVIERVSDDADAIEVAILDAEGRQSSLTGAFIDLSDSVVDSEPVDEDRPAGSEGEQGEEDGSASWHDPAWGVADWTDEGGAGWDGADDKVEEGSVDPDTTAERVLRPWEDG